MVRSLMFFSAKSAMLAGVAVGALMLAYPDMSHAQGQGQGGSSESGSGGGGNSDSGSGGSGGGGNSDSGSGGSGGSSDSGSGGDGGSGSGQQGAGGQGGSSDNEAAAEDDGEVDGDDPPDWSGQRGGDPDRGSSPTTDSGRPEDKGGKPEGTGGGDDDSDRPDWAGTPGGSAARGGKPDAGDGGDLYGDLYIILRDAQGVPILSPEGFVQPIDAEGNLIPVDAEGAVLPEFEALVQEVDIGRTNVARSPDSVLENRSAEVIDALNNATAISFDATGRLVVTVDGVASTIDSPLENLAIYTALMTTGTIAGVDNPALGDVFLIDGVKTAEDLAAAATFLAAATDKSSPFTADEIAYLNLILDIETATIEGTEIKYSAVDYSTFTYDRETTFGDVTATILVQQEDGSWVSTEVNVYDLIFNSEPDAATDGTFDAFTQAAEDARVVINYIHEYTVPVPPEGL